MANWLEMYQKSGQKLPEDVPQELQDLLKNVKKQKGQPTNDVESEDVVPEPFFVVKTTDDAGQKVFINMCGSPKIAAPGDWSKGAIPEEVSKALENANDVDNEGAQALRIPLSCGDIRRDVDKKGDMCSLVDCIFNLDVVKQASVARQLKVFLINLALQWVGHKGKRELDAKYKLPKMKYKGSHIQTQRIRVDKKPLVTEIKDIPEEPVFPLRATKAPAPPEIKPSQPPPAAQKAPNGGAAQQAAGTTGTSGRSSSSAAAMEYSIEFEGRPVEFLNIAVTLPPAVASSSEPRLSASVCAQDVVISADGCQPLHVKCPLAVSRQGGSAVYEQGVLRLRLPYRSLASVVDEMQRNAPHAFGSVNLATSNFLELEP